MDIRASQESVRLRIARACRRAGRSPEEVTLVAVTKGVAPSVIAAAFELGIRNFGENRVQEAEEKIKQLSHLKPRPVWHMIGHLQSNKVKPALALFDIIQSVDSVKLAQLISRYTRKKVPVLLQVNVSGEASKSGFPLSELGQAFEAISRLPQIGIKGLMTIAPVGDNPEDVRPVFRKLWELGDSFRLEHLSMGMTDDFEVAIEEGATMVRLGRALFGERG
ncbi:MAG: YggS family pyridoxal phosphate-dependent enzyme [Dehalococcoidia bacterium]|nr:YggS family pyridoxal phosphate-dependent enzyme [Dehalococcoidia bacterium]